MGSSFRRGFITGLLGPLAFLIALVTWIYRSTGKLPFPIKSEQEGELLVALVPPEEVQAHWQVWQQDLAPAVAKVRALYEDVRDTFLSSA
ncbi:MAG TPA: hypothetical protein GX714_00460 [Chloroflexi bacterium]|jgi:hypothetical protein|nr:hypothetical protein [Chloroflexota bacterium]